MNAYLKSPFLIYIIGVAVITLFVFTRYSLIEESSASLKLGKYHTNERTQISKSLLIPLECFDRSKFSIKVDSILEDRSNQDQNYIIDIKLLSNAKQLPGLIMEKAINCMIEKHNDFINQILASRERKIMTRINLQKINGRIYPNFNKKLIGDFIEYKLRRLSSDRKKRDLVSNRYITSSELVGDIKTTQIRRIDLVLIASIFAINFLVLVLFVVLFRKRRNLQNLI